MTLKTACIMMRSLYEYHATLVQRIHDIDVLIEYDKGREWYKEVDHFQKEREKVVKELEALTETIAELEKMSVPELERVKREYKRP